MKAWMRNGSQMGRPSTPLEIRVFKRNNQLVLSIEVDLGGNFPRTVEIGADASELASALNAPEVEEVVETIDDMLG